MKFFTLPIIVEYRPNIKSNVEPDIPGSIIADIAIIPAKNTYTPICGEKVVVTSVARVVVLVDTGLKYVINPTISAPSIRYGICLVFAFIRAFSSLYIRGMEKTMKPKKRELII